MSKNKKGTLCYGISSILGIFPNVSVEILNKDFNFFLKNIFKGSCNADNFF